MAIYLDHQGYLKPSVPTFIHVKSGSGPLLVRISEINPETGSIYSVTGARYMREDIVRSSLTTWDALMAEARAVMA